MATGVILQGRRAFAYNVIASVDWGQAWIAGPRPIFPLMRKRAGRGDCLSAPDRVLLPNKDPRWAMARLGGILTRLEPEMNTAKRRIVEADQQLFDFLSVSQAPEAPDDRVSTCPGRCYTR